MKNCDDGVNLWRCHWLIASVTAAFFGGGGGENMALFCFSWVTFPPFFQSMILLFFFSKRHLCFLLLISSIISFPLSRLAPGNERETSLIHLSDSDEIPSYRVCRKEKEPQRGGKCASRLLWRILPPFFLPCRWRLTFSLLYCTVVPVQVGVGFGNSA